MTSLYPHIFNGFSMFFLVACSRRNAPSMTSRKVYWLGLAAIFLGALVLRLAYWHAARSGPLGNPDSPAYQDLAEKLKAGQPYDTAYPAGGRGFPADLQRPPGYPVFLYLVNPQAAISRVQTAFIQSILGAVCAVLLAIFASRLISPTVGVGAGFFYAIDWASIVHTPLVIAETTYTIVLTLAIGTYAWYLTQQRLYFSLGAGLLLGLAALVKPAGQVLILALLLAWMCRQPRRAAGVVFLLTFGVVLLPWMWRNYHKHGLFTISAAHVDIVLWAGMAALSPIMYPENWTTE